MKTFLKFTFDSLFREFMHAVKIEVKNLNSLDTITTYTQNLNSMRQNLNSIFCAVFQANFFGTVKTGITSD